MIQDIVLKNKRKSTYSISPAFFVALSLLMFLALARAQTPGTSPYVLTTYDIETLASRPGEIRVGTRVQTHLEFDDLIEDAKSARSDWFTIEQSGSRLSLRANQEAGRTDLMVISGGRTALFTLVIDDALEAPRRYVIKQIDKPVPRVSGSRPKLLQQSRSSRFSSSPADSRSESMDALPSWLEFQTEITYAPNGAAAIHYALANQSSRYLTADVTQLRLDVLDPIAGPQKLPYTLSRVSAEGLSNRVAPDGVEFGTLLVKDMPELPIQLTWSVVQVGPGHFYTLRRTFDASLFRNARP